MTRANQYRAAAIGAMRALPRLRGHGKLAHAINGYFLSAGAAPVTTASMLLGHRLVLDARVQSHAWALFNGQYSDGEIRILAALLPPGGAMIDVGANIGFYAVPFGIAARRVGGRVVAFEPFPANCARLRENLTLNGLDDIVTVYPAGLSSTTDTALLTLREDFAQGSEVGNASIVIDDGRDAAFRTIPIKLVRLDDIWPSLGLERLDVVKVDIEGHEDLFLEGARQTLDEFRPVILTEVNRWYYQRRGIDFDTAIPARLPARYRFFQMVRPRIPLPARARDVTEIADLATCRDGDVFLVPDDKVGAFRAAVAAAQRRGTIFR